MKPWHDCPKCPHGCGSIGVPIRAANWNHRANPGERIVCPNCGRGWVGTPEEVAQAERAQLAWYAAVRAEAR
jgi:hypothetical protein